MGRTKTNALGLTKEDYKFRPSTLCPGCGHNSISNQIISVTFEESLDQTHIIKMSGIGCSSKSPAYFLGRSHAFNAVHGRMPSVTTGAVMANRTLRAISVSGDGDSGNIGLGQFKHVIRRNLPMVYIIENNGVYGLTKGQFSATADRGQKTKYAGYNELPAVDLCIEALAANATFVARSFSGDAKQVQAILKAALAHNGTAVVDIISPCVTFNDLDTSTKSYHWGKNHREILNEIGFIQSQEEIAVEYEPGTAQPVQMHDGSWIVLKKLGADHDPTDRVSAFRVLHEAQERQEIVTGIIYIDPSRPTLVETEHLPETPLVHLPETQIRPAPSVLEQALQGMFAF
ncbi:MAG: 2-oxoglutarate ferredoxin oxidoreductase subunit beta [Phototrophicales bacterium]|nr:MAG: 2-oxoglutarate ferredoxin oxidoreductase subunit beta [Phototrophicales bacterium]